MVSIFSAQLVLSVNTKINISAPTTFALNGFAGGGKAPILALVPKCST